MSKFWIRLNGKSMQPLLFDLDNILVEEVPFESLSLGDIVLFLDQTSKELTLHRLIAFPFKTKGDFSLCVEENSQDCFVGKAIGFSRNGFYRRLPDGLSFICKLFLFLSVKRKEGFFLRKMALLGLIFLAKLCEFCNDKTMINHSEELILDDL